MWRITGGLMSLDEGRHGIWAGQEDRIRSCVAFVNVAIETFLVRRRKREQGIKHFAWLLYMYNPDIHNK
jgi:hypothetical protein